MLRTTLFALALTLISASAPASEPDLRPNIGETPPSLLGRDLAGRDIDLRKMRGKVVVISFWASWCGPCRRELPVLAHLQSVVSREHLEIIAINFKEHRRDFREVVRANRKLDLTYVHDADGKIGADYGVVALPNLFIIDGEGKVAYRKRGYTADDIGPLVEEILAALPPEVANAPAESNSKD